MNNANKKYLKQTTDPNLPRSDAQSGATLPRGCVIVEHQNWRQQPLAVVATGVVEDVVIAGVVLLWIATGGTYKLLGHVERAVLTGSDRAQEPAALGRSTERPL